LATVEVFNQRFEIIFFDSDDRHFAFRVLTESDACAALTMIVCPNSFRIEPGGAFAGSSGAEARREFCARRPRPGKQWQSIFPFRARRVRLDDTRWALCRP
jgi:hypothetical protein